MGSLYYILSMALDLAWWILIVHVIMSWLINFQVLNLRQPLVYQIWYGLNRILEPVYSRIRSVIPPMGGIDFAPLVALFGLAALRIILAQNAQFFL